jgi:hypothetical protein
MNYTYRKYDPSTYVAGGRLSHQFAEHAPGLTPEEEAWIAESVAKNPWFGTPKAKISSADMEETDAMIAEQHPDTARKLADKVINERPDEQEPDDFIGQITK